MEVKFAKSKVIQIPIEEFEEDIDTGSFKEKKNEILNLFTNYNDINSEDEFNEIEEYLHIACKEGNIELIKILLNETIENESKELQFKIDKRNHTASLFKVNYDIDEIIIPRGIQHDSTYYLLTSIIGTGYDISTITITENSSIKTIFGKAFELTQIKEIYFPATLVELKEGWCSDVECLNNIIISPSNNNFIFKDDKYLLGKSDQNKDEFDTLLFARRDIEEISIPSNIKIISSYAFQYCENLTKVEIPTNSNLQKIEKYAFNSSGIRSIFIPPKVSKICDNSFGFCEFLEKIEIPENSSLQIIEENAFYESYIDEIYFPASLKELKDGWCNNTVSLNKIVISPLNNHFIFKDDKYLLGKSDQNKDEFDTLLFARRDIEKISIPSNIKIISSYAFQYCENLTKVEIPTNSNLKTIEENAFKNSNVEEISFPNSFIDLKEGWCDFTNNLIRIIIPPSNNHFIFKDGNYLLGKSNQNKDEFDTLLFVRRDIEEISIPSNIKIISSYAFANCKNLTKVEIPTNSDLQIIKKYAFLATNIKEIYIPPKISKIGECAFYGCFSLSKIEIPTNSNLQSIGDFAFTHLLIKEIFIPQKVSKISKSLFSDCKFLTKIKIPINSNLQTIESNALYNTDIRSFFITPKISKICKNSFLFCENLLIIEISEESKLVSFPLSAFYGNSKCLFMIPSS